MALLFHYLTTGCPKKKSTLNEDDDLMMGKTRSGSEIALKRVPPSTTAVNLGVNSEN